MTTHTRLQRTMRSPYRWRGIRANRTVADSRPRCQACGRPARRGTDRCRAHPKER